MRIYIMSNTVLGVDDLRSGKRYDFRYNNENCTGCTLEVVSPNELAFAQPGNTEDDEGVTWDLRIPMDEAQNIDFYVTADGDTDVESQYSQYSQGGKRKTKKSKKSKKSKTSKTSKKTKKSRKSRKSKK